MILRDPIHGLIAFEDEEERVIQSLLATSEVQRLRRVRQLGLASLVFPGAEHSRFSHAIGTAWVMSRLLDRIGHVQEGVAADQRLDPASRREAIAAALLHDLGHGPFSHLYEEVLPGAPRHEQWTADLILHPDTDVHRALAQFGQDTAHNVAELVRGRHRLPYLGLSVSGTLDVDRCDYLLRDSHMTGVRYGIYDLDWLLRALTLGEVTDPEGARRTVLAIEGRKGLPPIEGFFLARNFMFQQVYHHKAVRAAEVLVRSIFARASERLRDPSDALVAPRALISAVRGEPATEAAYLDLDDASLTSCIAAWQRDSDPVLADLAKRFMRRNLPKTLPLPEGPGCEPLWAECQARASEIATAEGFRADLHVWLDAPVDIPYAEDRDVAPGVAAVDPLDGLWVSLRHRPMARLGDVSFLLRELRNKRTVRPRLVFPAELREKVLRAVEPLLA